MTDDAKQNTDRELWREREGDYYADSILVTAGGNIGINCGGKVIVMPLRDWHEAALRQRPQEEPLDWTKRPDRPRPENRSGTNPPPKTSKPDFTPPGQSVPQAPEERPDLIALEKKLIEGASYFEDYQINDGHCEDPAYVSDVVHAMREAVRVLSALRAQPASKEQP